MTRRATQAGGRTGRPNGITHPTAGLAGRRRPACQARREYRNHAIMTTRHPVPGARYLLTGRRPAARTAGPHAVINGPSRCRQPGRPPVSSTSGQPGLHIHAEQSCAESARTCRRQGLPDCRGAGISVRKRTPHGVRHPGGETGRRSRRRGRAAGTPARTAQMPPVPSIWIPGRRWAPAADHPAGPNPAGGPARERRGGADRRGSGRQGAGGCGCPERPRPYSGVTLSDEGGSGRTHARAAVRCD
jgi:hypothetical protein